MRIKKTIALATLSTCLVLGLTSGSLEASLIKKPSNSVENQLPITFVSTKEKKAEEFINKMGVTAVSFLGNANLTPDQKKSEFKKLLKNNFDMKTIGRFALGKNWNLASAAEQQEYLKLFEKMVVEVYSKRFDDYQGQKFEVKSSRAVGSKSDVLVSTLIVPEEGPKVDVDWRVRNKNGKMQIIDVIIEGVSMSLTQRSDFSSVVQRGGGKIEPLLVHLRK